MLLRPQATGHEDVLSLTGHVAGDDTPTIRAALEGRSGPVVLDLQGVTTVSVDAVDALRRLTDGSAATLDLRGACPQVQQAFTGLSVHPPAVAVERAVVIEPGPHGPAQARRVVEACAEQLGLADEADDLVLLVSELVTNAIRYGAPPVELRVQADPHTVTVTVADRSPVPPLHREADDSAEGGRGMALVDLLTDGHGVRPEPDGKAVWASVRRRPAPS